MKAWAALIWHMLIGIVGVVLGAWFGPNDQPKQGETELAPPLSRLEAALAVAVFIIVGVGAAASVRWWLAVGAGASVAVVHH